jgi:hypothetical protein
MTENAALFALAISLPTATAAVWITLAWLKSRDRNKQADRAAVRAALPKAPKNGETL